MAWVKPHIVQGEKPPEAQPDIDCGKCRWIDRSLVGSKCNECYVSKDKFNFEEGEPDENGDLRLEEMGSENCRSCS